jgi:hypothetical protein
LLITGCSKEGILKLLNYSQEEIWYRIDYGYMEYLPSYTQISYSWDLASSIFGEDDKSVTVDYGGGYWWWYDYTTTRKIKPGKTVSIEIKGDAGEIAIWNNSWSFYIEEVYLSPSSDPSWGLDDLIGDIWPGETVTWKVTTGYWDIKVVDDWGDVFTSYGNYVDQEETIEFEYTGFKKSSAPDSEKKANAANYTELTEDRCEQRQ